MNENSQASINIANELKQVGLRPSSVRVHVLGYIRTEKNHPTVDTVYTNLCGTLPSLSKTSVYNTVALLTEHGLLRSLPIEGNEQRYDGNLAPHVHFKCTRCGEIYDIFASDLEIDIKLPKGFIAEEQCHFVRGICGDCSQKSRSKPKPN